MRARHLVNEDPQRVLPIPAIRQLDKIVVPTLIIVGERDMPHFHGIAKVLEQGIPNSHKVTLEGAGHVSNMEDPESFNREVLSFLESLR
jgi:pimeloyl-ACP methyl ester carboxylesterase